MSTSYILIKNSIEADRAAAQDVIVTTLRWINGEFQCNFIDESYLPHTVDIETLVLRVEGEHPAEQLASDLKVLLGKLPSSIEIQIIPSADDWPVEMEDVDIQYFRNETEIDSRMSVRGLSCVRLIHRPSGIVARCTSTRNRQRNFEGATALLKGILASSSKGKLD